MEVRVNIYLSEKGACRFPQEKYGSATCEVDFVSRPPIKKYFSVLLVDVYHT